MTISTKHLYLTLENIKMALASIWDNKVRSFLTLLGIMIGVFAVITIVALGSGLRDRIGSMVASMGANVLDIVPGKAEGGHGPPGMFGEFSAKDIEAMREPEGIEYVAETIQAQVQAKFRSKEMGTYLVGTQPEYFKILETEIIAGESFTSADVSHRNRVAVVGLSLAETLFGSAERAIGREFTIGGKRVRVVGVLEEQDIQFGGINADEFIYAPATITQALAGVSNIREVIAKVRDDTDQDQTIKELEKALKKVRGNNEFTVMTQEGIMKTVDEILGIITAALAGIAAISLLVGGIGIMNIMLVSVTERTKEIGIRKALGATDGQILIQFLSEAIVLCLVGAAIGLGLSTGTSVLIERLVNFPPIINFQTVLAACAFAILVGVVFGTAPALKAAKKDPIEALRHE